MARWTDVTRRAGAIAWIDEQSARIGARRTGGIEQPHVRPCSWRVTRLSAGSGDPGEERDLHFLRAEPAVLTVEVLYEAAGLVPVDRLAVAW